MARRRLSENMIRINVYFGYKFFVIKILSVHTILRIVIFDFFFGILSLLTLVSFLGCVGGKKSMCLLQHKGNGHAVFVFVAAGRSDQAPQSVSTQCHSVISLWTIHFKKKKNKNKKNSFSSAFASWRIYANLYLCVCLCVREHTYIQEYVYGRQYL